PITLPLDVRHLSEFFLSLTRPQCTALDPSTNRSSRRYTQYGASRFVPAFESCAGVLSPSRMLLQPEAEISSLQLRQCRLRRGAPGSDRRSVPYSQWRRNHE